MVKLSGRAARVWLITFVLSPPRPAPEWSRTSVSFQRIGPGPSHCLFVYGIYLSLINVAKLLLSCSTTVTYLLFYLARFYGSSVSSRSENLCIASLSFSSLCSLLEAPKTEALLNTVSCNPLMTSQKLLHRLSWV